MGCMHKGCYNIKEFQKLLRDNNFEFVRQTGSHRIYKRGSEILSLPTSHPAQTTLYDLIKQYNLKED